MELANIPYRIQNFLKKEINKSLLSKTVHNLLESYYNDDFDIDFVEEITFSKEFIGDEEEDDLNDIDLWQFDITCYDANGEGCLTKYGMDYEDLVDTVGEENAQYIWNSETEDGRFWNDAKGTTPSDINNVNEVNTIAKKCFTVSEYYPDERGYILTDGSFIYFGSNVDHVSISRIDGMTVGKFVSLGNIRVGQGMLELELPPTYEQKRQLYKLIGGAEEDIYVDIVKYSGKGQYSNTLDGCRFPVGSDPQSVLNQIQRFFNEGIKMSPYELDESKKYKKRNQLINEITNLAQNSNITITSLNDFKKLVSSLGINDSNVDQYANEYAFIEIGSSLSRMKTEVPIMPPMFDDSGNEYDGESFFNKGQWYFSNEHENVIKLVFDDNQKFNNKTPNKDGFDGKTPATAVKLSPHENRYNKNMTFYYADGEDFTEDKVIKLKDFVDKCLEKNPNIKFIIHCMQGKSRSAAVGIYIAKKINQFTDDFLSEYDNNDNSQFNIGISKKGQPKYPHKNALERLGAAEGWNKPKEETKKQWYYNTLINHPKTGFLAKKNKVTENIKKRRIIITEKQLKKIINEDVFVSDVNDATGKATLSYKKHNGSNRGNLNSFDYLKTDKMEQDNNDTYIVPLKNGLLSYNITSIKGSSVMHYFKNIFSGKKTNITLTDGFDKDEYELVMADSEFRNFMNIFENKVSTVIEYAINDFKTKNPDFEFETLLIYPVPSSSNFNIAMARILEHRQIMGMSPKMIDSNILYKDFSKIEIDNNFIDKNKEYYDSALNDKFADNTHRDHVIKNYNRLNAFKFVKEKIVNINSLVDKIVNTFKKVDKMPYSEKWHATKELFSLYKEYVKEYKGLYKRDLKYDNPLSINDTTAISSGKHITELHDLNTVSNDLFALLWIQGILPKKYKDNLSLPVPLMHYKLNNLEIKSLSNDVRLGLTNYFSVSDDNADKDLLKDENKVIMIFDDNISGGATLSDICSKLQQLGAKYIVPITFGKMKEQWGTGTMPINKPKNPLNFN